MLHKIIKRKLKTKRLNVEFLINSEVLITGLLIFLARIIDVSMGTLRIIFISKGRKIQSTIIGFFEILIWLVAITRIMENLTNPVYYIFYASGFAIGTYVGILIEERLALGFLLVRIITKTNARRLIMELELQGYPVTHTDARRKRQDVHIIYAIIHRKDLEEIIKSIKQFNPKAIYSVEEIKKVSDGALPPIRRNRFNLNILNGKGK